MNCENQSLTYSTSDSFQDKDSTSSKSFKSYLISHRWARICDNTFTKMKNLFDQYLFYFKGRLLLKQSTVFCIFCRYLGILSIFNQIYAQSPCNEEQCFSILLFLLKFVSQKQYLDLNFFCLTEKIENYLLEKCNLAL